MTTTKLSDAALLREQTERRLKSLGISKQSYKTIKLSSIDLDTSKKLNARTETARHGADADHVLVMAAAMERGVAFPPQVVHEEDGKFVYDAGVHRHEAYDLNGVKQVEMLVIDADEEHRKRFRIMDNAAHGRGLTMRDRCWQAFALIEGGAASIEEAAEFLDLGAENLARDFEIYQLDRALEQAGVDTNLIARKGDKKAILELPSYRLMKEMSRLVADFTKAEFQGLEVEALCRAVRDEKDDLQRSRLIDAKRSALVTNRNNAENAASKRRKPDSRETRTKTVNMRQRLTQLAGTLNTINGDVLRTQLSGATDTKEVVTILDEMKLTVEALRETVLA